jgi:putative transposase
MHPAAAEPGDLAGGEQAGLNEGTLRSGWGLLVRRLQDKAPGRVEKVMPHFTSQRCSACGYVDPDSRESRRDQVRSRHQPGQATAIT